MKCKYLFFKDSRGSATVMLAILMFAFVGLLAFVIDLAHLQNVKTELSNAADDCALRGARAFLPDNLPLNDQLLKIDPDPFRAVSQASLAIGDNRSDDNAFHMANLIDLPAGDINYGIWDYTGKFTASGKPDLLPWNWPPDSSLWGQYIGPGVRLPVQRDDTHNRGQVSMTLARMFKVNQVAVGAKATAALSGVGGVYPGSPVLPFGTWDNLLPPPGSPPLHGTFNVDQSDTLGWTNLNPKDTNPNANELKTIMNQGAQYDCPYGSTVGLENGVSSSVIQAMTQQATKKQPLNRFGLIPDPNSTGNNVYIPSTDPNPASPGDTYASTVYMMPVFSDGSGPGGNKFNQSAMVGGVPVQIVRVASPPGNYIDVKVMAGPYVAPGYGGGAWYGVLATEPKLVGTDLLGY
jgi:Putative Flp pilus-assembly TadE/G-like